MEEDEKVNERENEERIGGREGRKGKRRRRRRSERDDNYSKKKKNSSSVKVIADRKRKDK